VSDDPSAGDVVDDDPENSGISNRTILLAILAVGVGVILTVLLVAIIFLGLVAL
jgi:hypothetical protein